MVIHDVFVIVKVLDEQKHSADETSRRSQHAEETKEVQWPSRIIEQKLHADQIQQYAQRARDIVIRFAVLALNIFDWNLSDVRPLPACQRRDESMQIAVQLQLRDYFSPVSFERSAEVMQINP